MQTFLPYPDFKKSAEALDDKRLGNQVYREVLTLIRGGWPHHPASRMWRGHFRALADYGLACLAELERRGRSYPHHVRYFTEIRNTFPDSGMPKWFGDEAFHASHRSNLLRKKPEHYRKFWPTEPDNLPYVWPV